MNNSEENNDNNKKNLSKVALEFSDKVKITGKDENGNTVIINNTKG